nr:single-stranded DNA-binding protein [Ignavibacteriaceae bacterium]
VEGRLTKRDYTDKEGIKRYSTDVISERIIPLDSSGEGGSNYSENTSSDSGVVNEMPPVDSNDDLPF